MEWCRSLQFLLTILAIPLAPWTAVEPPKQPRSAKSNAAAQPDAKHEVAALVNGQRIMLSELMGRLRELGVTAENQEQVASDVLDVLIDNALLVQFLAAQKVPCDEKM